VVREVRGVRFSIYDPVPSSFFPEYLDLTVKVRST
jgi:hypothetical protein